jgi:hypothetical protein
MTPSLSLDRVVKTSYALLRKRLGRLVAMSALLIAAYVLAVGLIAAMFTLPAGTARDLAASVAIAFGVVGLLYLTYGYNASVIRIVEVEWRGGELGSVSEIFASVKKRIWPLFGMSLFVGVVSLVGFLFFVIPGIFLSLIWCVVSPVVVVEGLGFAALDRSQRLAKGSKWGVLGLLAVIACIFFLLYAVFFIVVMVLAAVFGAAGGGTAGGVVGGIAQIGGYLVLMPLGALIPSVLYFELLGIEGGLPPAAVDPPNEPAPAVAPSEPLVPAPPAPPTPEPGAVPPPPPPPEPQV